MVLYKEIKQSLFEKIMSMQADEVIESERELSLKYQVSRMTLRKAINELVDEGYLYRKKNVGTFVSDKSISKVVESNDLKLTNYPYKIVYFNYKEAEDEIRELLKLKTYEEVLRVVRVNYNKQEANSVEELYMKRSFAKDEFDLDKLVSKLDDYQSNVEIELIEIPSKYVNFLKLDLNTQVIKITHVYYDESNNIIGGVICYNKPSNKISFKY